MPYENAFGDEFLNELKNMKGKVMRGFISISHLIEEMQKNINEGICTAFVLGRHANRQFFCIGDGFTPAMIEVEKGLTNHAVIVEPNRYGSRWIFAVGPRNTLILPPILAKEPS